MILDNKNTNLKVHEWIAKYTKEGKFSLATLPGILKASLAMPDMHWGYGFPFSQLIERRVVIKKNLSQTQR